MAAYAGPDSDLTPDADQIGAFLYFWFKKCNAGVIEIGWLDRNGRGLIHFARFPLNDQAAAVATAVQENLIPGQSVYVRACTVRDRTTGFTSDADFVQAPGIWNDLDTAEQVAFAASVVSIVRPTAVVYTGRIPHDRIQPWFLVSEPIVSAGLVRSLNQRLHKLYGGDPAVVNPTRLMRLPGTIAWPVKAGRVPELTAFVRPGPDDRRPSAYPLSTLTSQLPEDAQPPPEQAAPAAEAGGISTVSSMIHVIRSGVRWHDNMIRLVAHWVGRGWSTAEILLAAEGLTLPGYTVQQTRQEVAKAIESARQKWGAPDQDEAVSEPAPDGVWQIADPWREADIAPRPWVAKGYLMRGHVSVLSGPGSAGKSSLVVAWTCACGTGTAFDQFRPRGPLRVLIYNVEDDPDEQRRRFSAQLRRMNLSPAQVMPRVRLVGPEQVGTLLTAGREGAALVETATLAALAKVIAEFNPDVIVFDPFVELHSSDENDNVAIRAVMATFRTIARERNAAVLLLHHSRKGGSDPGNPDSLRGASAIVGAARVALTLNVMTADEAQKLGVDEKERFDFSRLDIAKSNYAPAQDAIWLRRQEVILDNARGGHEADGVAAVWPWRAPTPWRNMQPEKIAAILNRIETGPGEGELYYLTGGTSARWAGSVIVEEAGVTEDQAKIILAAWRKNGVLLTETYWSARDRKERNGAKVNMVKFAEMTR